jgi:hypothetical protein
MTDYADFEALAKEIIHANRNMTHGTADENGLPWASPVWYAPAGYSEFFWVSSPEARHSRNVTTRPQIGIVIFDSQAPIGTGRGVYMSAVAEGTGRRQRRPRHRHFLRAVRSEWSPHLDRSRRATARASSPLPRGRTGALCPRPT